jgi:hypothetical protein
MALALFVVILVAETAPGPAARSVGAAVPVDVTYEVFGTATSAAVDVQRPTGTQQVTATLPLMDKSGVQGLTMTFAPGSLVYVSAQNQGDSGTVTCRITVNGVLLDEKTATKARSFATCTGKA